MHSDRCKELLDAYGADTARWPAAERDALEAFADGEPGALAWLAEARALDALLDSYRVPALEVAQRVMAALPESRADRFLAWLLPRAPREVWRPVLAATLPLLLGVVIGVNGPAGAAGSLDWAAAEEALLAPQLEVGWYE